MATHQIELTDITFDLERGTDRLKFPHYGNLINDKVVTAEHRQWMQLEPAFQFQDAGDQDIYEFIFRIAPGEGVVFFPSADGQPMRREASGAVLPAGLVACSFPDATFKVCKVRVEPSLWGEAPRVITLRILCKPAQGSPAPDWSYGVSLSLIGSGGGVRAVDSGLAAPLDEPHLDVEVSIGSDGIPRYNVFKPLVLPVNLSLEPAFRICEQQTEITLNLNLVSPGYCFEAADAGEDQVVVMKSAAARPHELSKLTADPAMTGARCTWQRGDTQYLAFGFTLQVGSARGQNGLWQAIPGADVDPILFNDPPPGGR